MLSLHLVELPLAAQRYQSWLCSGLLFCSLFSLFFFNSLLDILLLIQLAWQLILGKKNPAKKKVRQCIDKGINPSLVCLLGCLFCYKRLQNMLVKFKCELQSSLSRQKFSSDVQLLIFSRVARVNYLCASWLEGLP